MDGSSARKEGGISRNVTGVGECRKTTRGARKSLDKPVSSRGLGNDTVATNTSESGTHTLTRHAQRQGCSGRAKPKIAHCTNRKRVANCKSSECSAITAPSIPEIDARNPQAHSGLILCINPIV